MLKTEVVPSQSHVHRAARWAVFTPCCGVQWKQQPIQDVLKHVRKLWVKTLDGLADVQAPGLGTLHRNGRLALTYSKNCPPFGISDKPMRRCNRAKICPFCYAREYVVKPMQTLESVLFSDAHGVPLAELNDAVIVDFTVGIRFDQPNRNWQTTPAMRAPVWATLLRTMTHGQKREVRQVPSYAAAVLQRVQFDNGYWTLLRSGVMVCDRNEYRLRKFEWADCEQGKQHVSAPTRENLARAVGRAFRYPDNVLVTSPEIVREYMEQLKSKKLLNRYGSIRLKRK